MEQRVVATRALVEEHHSKVFENGYAARSIQPGELEVIKCTVKSAPHNVLPISAYRTNCPPRYVHIHAIASRSNQSRTTLVSTVLVVPATGGAEGRGEARADGEASQGGAEEEAGAHGDRH